MENPDKYVKIYLQKGGDPSASFSVMGPVGAMIDKPLLHAGVVNSRAGPGALRLRIAAGADLEAECVMDGDSRTALMWASVNARYIEHMRVLLDAGACTTSSSADSFTAFGIASEKGNVEGVKKFIKRGVDPNLRAMPSMHTPLLKAVGAGHLPIAMLLIRYVLACTHIALLHLHAIEQSSM
jgi:ankyrin repeat protein